VDNPTVFNVAKGGQAIPVKFSLGGNRGLTIFAAGYAQSQQVACDGLATQDVVEETLTAGSSSLSYDASTDQYTYVWKTNKAWAHTCQPLIIRLSDGTDHIAYFDLK
jgi:S-adenosylhomocysteine hydrolase